MERKPVFLEGEEVKHQLLATFGERGQVAVAIHMDGLALKHLQKFTDSHEFDEIDVDNLFSIHTKSQPHLDVFATGHFLKVLLLLEGLVHFVVRHAEAAQPSLNRVVHLGEDHKLGQVRHADQLPV